MGIPAGVATSMLVSLLPTRLNELGFSLPFGGFSIMVFGTGGAIGVLVWSAVAHRKSEIFATTASLAFAFLFMTIYFIFYKNNMAVWILFLAGFCGMPTHTLMITMARYAAGPNLGQRMGVIVGGTWASASIIVLGGGIIAEHIGVGTVIKFTAVSYLISCVLAFMLMYRTANLLKNAEPVGIIKSNLIEDAES
jgi:predicted MFS family arabinose efflux permease